MNIISHKDQNFNHQGKPAPDILSTSDLIEHMAAHYQGQAQALEAERGVLAAAMTEALCQAGGMLT